MTPLRNVPHNGYGLVVDGLVGSPVGQVAPYLDAILADPIDREAFFALVDEHGVVV